MALNRWRFAALALLGLFTALSLGARGFATLGALISARGAAQVPFGLEEASAQVVSVQPPAEAAGLRAGDRLLAVGEEPYVGRKVRSRAASREIEGATRRTWPLMFRRC